jgi:hypothetical protein
VKMKPFAFWMLASIAILGVSAHAPSANTQKPGDPGFPYGDLKEVTLQGKLIPLAEVLAKKYGARAVGGANQLALALPEGQLYTFLENDQFQKLAAAKLTGQAVEVHARLFPRSMLLELLTFKPLPVDSIQRRFFCPVCTIYTEEWGPCVCCGQEMTLVK